MIADSAMIGVYFWGLSICCEGFIFEV